MGDDDELTPSVSRLHRGETRGYRILSRASDRQRNRFLRQRRQVPIEQLIGLVLRHRGLTDKVRQRVICMYWPEIAGERIAAKTWPVSFAEAVLHVSVVSSSWVHELQFYKSQLIAQIRTWLEANRVWLGPPQLVTDIRFALDAQQREPLVDRDHARRIRLRHVERSRPPREVAPPPISDPEREAIREETSRIADPDVRALIESVRIRWNR